MKLDDTVMVQFFGELIESYRQQIMDQEEARELSKKEKKFLADLRKELEQHTVKPKRSKNNKVENHELGCQRNSADNGCVDFRNYPQNRIL